MDKKQKEFQELQKVIDTIIATSRLVGHKVMINPVSGSIKIRKQGKLYSFMVISLYDSKTVAYLHTTYNGNTVNFKNSDPHQDKLNRLNYLLQKL